MALRAGYYGIKRGLKAKLAEIAGAWDETISSLFPRDEQAVLGAKNLLAVENFQGDINGITYNIADGIVNMSGASTGATGRTFGNFTFKGGVTYYLSGNPSNNANIWLGVYNTSTIRYEYVQSSNMSNVVAIKYDEDTTRRINIRVGVGETVNNLQMKPMIALSSDEIFVPYAMTNRKLTDSAADQKTAINAIITAATGAADFAAFKTAMGTITPVTRSLNRAASPEDVPEEVIEEEKPVTKKTTRKTVKEGE